MADRMADGGLVELLDTLAVNEGYSPSLLGEVKFLRMSKSVPREPIVYDPCIIIVGQGRKRVFLGEESYLYDSRNYLVLSVPLPLECETEAKPGKPLLAVYIKVEPTVLGELLMEMEDGRKPPGMVRGIYSTPFTADLECATVRLLECLRSPMDSRILGSAVVREITYRVLCGEQGDALRAVATRHSHFSQIARVLRRVHQDYHLELDVESLAREANMSVSNFHHNFKAVTSTSPVQYLKSIRLHKARSLMFQGEYNVSKAANEVGYSSISQFSREFKRFFGITPSKDSDQLRT